LTKQRGQGHKESDLMDARRTLNIELALFDNVQLISHFSG
jgi:hypothetical protein